jgi:hypothetical protein
LVFNIGHSRAHSANTRGIRLGDQGAKQFDGMEAARPHQLSLSTADAVLHTISSVTRALSGVMCVAVLLSLIFLVLQIRSDAIVTIDSANFAIQSIAPAVSNMTHSVESMLSGADASLESVREIAHVSEIVALQSAGALGQAINQTLQATENFARVAMHPVLKLSLVN